MNRIDQVVSDAEKIPGWMNPVELRWLATQASFRKRIVEFGSWVGRSTYALSQLTGGVVYAVDTWTGEIEGKLVDKDCEAKFFENLKVMIAVNRVRPLKMKTTEAAQALYGFKPDMVFIDADHSYEGITADIRNSWDLLACGGLLCGHDYSNDYPDVRKVVDLFCSAKKLEGGDIWYCEKP